MAAGNIQRPRLIGDTVGVLWTPNNYNPAAATGFSTGADQLTSHLHGIDTKLGSVASVVSATATAGEDLLQYQAVYVDTVTNKIKKSANNQTESTANFFGIVSQSGGILTDATGTVTLNGLVTNGTWNWTPFLYVYVGATAGSLTQTPPTSDGQFVVPVGVAMSNTSIQVNPQTGWTVSGVSPVFGVGKLAFTETTGTGTLVTPPRYAIITQVVIVVSQAAGGAGGTVSVGTPTDTDIDLPTSYVDLTSAGIYIYEPFNDCGVTPLPEVLTVVAGGQTFIGTAYIFYAVPNQLTGNSGFTKVDFTQDSISPVTVIGPPDNATITKVICIVDTARTSGTPTLSVGIADDTDRDMTTLDNDLEVQGTYLYEPYTDVGTNASPIIITLTGHGTSGVEGRIFVWYIVPD
jgi:hypothetical protein